MRGSDAKSERKQRHTRVLKKTIARLDSENQTQVNNWVQGMKQGLVKVAEAKDVIGELIGLPFDVRPDLHRLHRKLGSMTVMLSGRGDKARTLRKQIKTFLKGDKTRDVVAVNRFATQVRRELDSMKALNRKPEFSNWPEIYTNHRLKP